MTITPFSSLQAMPNQRSGATVKAILPDGRIIAEIGNDIFKKEDALALEKIQAKLEKLTKKYTQIEESEAHSGLYDALGDEYYDRLVLLSPDRSKISGAISFGTDNKEQSCIQGLASLKRKGGKGLVAYILDTCLEKSKRRKVELISMSDDNHYSFLNGEKEPSKAATFWDRFGFYNVFGDSSSPDGGELEITYGQLTPYAHDAMKSLDKTNLPEPFALPHDLIIDDGNKFS
jgi:hypothetical protein